jgi:hypothetical protein
MLAFQRFTHETQDRARHSDSGTASPSANGVLDAVVGEVKAGTAELEALSAGLKERTAEPGAGYR